MEAETTYTISEVSGMTGLPADTLRYYEKIGLVASPDRGAGLQRLYTKEDIGRIRFLTHLKRTHMPLRKIREYVQRYDQQDEEQCFSLLDEHRQAIESRLEELTATLELIRYKLDHFQEIKDGKQGGNGSASFTAEGRGSE
ncbi:MerR family transcriptional regulator [Paenibacillus stellifer]|uniref:MerR family transcriptional regulator n=1 Tax=Paenibacillus stellifer TaxID=169760 RepID=UPI000691C4B1|nr:MerR family transcriptional regulator [Paenibacillus stellifer]